MAITNAYRTRSDAVQLRSFKAKGRPSAIAGMGVYAPDKVITNFDLEKMMETSDKWITERTGIHKRHIAEPGTPTFESATKAARAALDAAGITAADLDMILSAPHRPTVHFRRWPAGSRTSSALPVLWPGTRSRRAPASCTASRSRTRTSPPSAPTTCC